MVLLFIYSTPFLITVNKIHSLFAIYTHKTSSSFKLTSLLFFILNNISFGWSVSEKFAPGPWQIGSATFYGGTMGGACGYGNLFETGYGNNTAALSTALFSNGQTCGACYEIQCLNSSQHCITSNTITITTTDFFPPNYNLPNDNGGWCNPPRQRFDMSQPAFEQIAIYRAGIIPVAFRRVPCVKSGGIRYTVNGNPYFNLVLVSNVAGAGDVVAVWLKGEFTEWIQMTRNWGQNWQNGDQLNYQSLSFRVMTSDQAVVTNWNVVPRGWQFGQTFEGDQNFNN